MYVDISEIQFSNKIYVLGQLLYVRQRCQLLLKQELLNLSLKYRSKLNADRVYFRKIAQAYIKFNCSFDLVT